MGKHILEILSYINLNKAIALAQAHVEHINQNLQAPDDYKYVLGAPVQYVHCYYFDYQVQYKFELSQDQWSMFTGAPGFVVNRKNGLLKTISWSELPQLPEQSALWQRNQALAVQLARNPITLATLRRYLPLPLPELVAFYIQLRRVDIPAHQKAAIILAQLMRGTGIE
ncbi:hypothetical protein [Hymenobacter fodinae]|uniref:Uncharacterized protein n=1 Tax=Hymenobacter fodinae TaxID=2510796 RepID=A0A4Z0P2A9_9BACT|nr:hypothetical protein [Hymenobacter fodinae]TGE04900.1 hypothetical protein EU556_22265 [Hymenobacter fodinae]